MTTNKISGYLLVGMAATLFVISTLKALDIFYAGQPVMKNLLSNWEYYFACCFLNLMCIPLVAGWDEWELPLISSTFGRIKTSTNNLAKKYNTRPQLKAIDVATMGTGKVELREYRLLETVLKTL